MLSTLFLLFLCCILQGAFVSCTDCITATSEGTRTLKHGEYACAPLASGQTADDEGRFFIICSAGAVVTMPCPPPLRFDVTTLTCNWEHLASCSFPDNQGGETSTDDNGPATSTPTAAPLDPTTPTTATTVPATRPSPSPGPCNASNCHLPNCFCYGWSPNSIPVEETPMFIMLTFDDAVTLPLYDPYFKPLLVDNDYELYNPDGCPIRSTFFLSDEYTDYDLVTSLAQAGHSIASHTINHRLPLETSPGQYQDAEDEIVGLREMVRTQTQNETLADSVLGFRSPFLALAGDVQFDVLEDNGFLYDSSIPSLEVQVGRTPLWPYTLDFPSPGCVEASCPSQPHPGLWEVPMNIWRTESGWSCAMIDACVVQGSYYDMYMNNFERYFYPTRVPMGIFTHGAMFLRSPDSYTSLVSFLQEILANDHVWLVTPTQVIQWMQNPITNAQMVAQRWGC